MKRKLNPFALRAILKKRDEHVADLRQCVRLLLPVAQRAIGAYPPEVVADLQQDLKAIRKILKETK